MIDQVADSIVGTLKSAFDPKPGVKALLWQWKYDIYIGNIVEIKNETGLFRVWSINEEGIVTLIGKDDRKCHIRDLQNKVETL